MRTVVVDGTTMVYADSCPYCDGKLENAEPRFGSEGRRVCMECRVVWKHNGTVFYEKDSKAIEVPDGCLLVRPEVEE